MIIGIITATNAQLPLGFVKSWLNVSSYPYILQEGPSIFTNRNEVFEKARFLKEDLLFIDSDIVFTREQVTTIEKHLETFDVVTGYYVMGFPGWPPDLFKKENDVYKICEPENGLFEVDGCGAGFLAMSQKVLDTLIEPFTPIQNEGTGQFYGEDISFCIRAQQAGFKIMCDSTLSVGHIKNNIKYYGKA